MRKIWDKIVAWFLSIPTDKRLHFVAGFIIASFFAISLGMTFCFWPVIFFAFGKEFFDAWTGGEFDWKDFVATLCGGALCQGLVALGVWWGFFGA